jgi:hypothetical protein
MVEAMWRVKLVAKKKSDVAREIASAAESLLGFKGINPMLFYGQEWKCTNK